LNGESGNRPPARWLRRLSFRIAHPDKRQKQEAGKTWQPQRMEHLAYSPIHQVGWIAGIAKHQGARRFS
jgi:hypothetical protein